MVGMADGAIAHRFAAGHGLLVVATAESAECR